MKSKQVWRRILVIDDNQAIHDDFRKTLMRNDPSSEIAAAEAALFGDSQSGAMTLEFDIDSAFQGREGCEKARKALQEGCPFTLAFVDMRMPPGWDGLETIRHLFEIDPEIQVVVCTAYSDYSWEQMFEKLGMTDRVLMLKKPFDRIEVRQLAAALTEKWNLKRQSQLKLGELEAMVHARTHELREQAHHDRLTGLPNRAYVMEKLSRLIQASTAEAKAQSTCALLFVDFDRFKTVNDSLGHEIGDELFLEISVRLRGHLNSWVKEGNSAGNSFIARLGGDEFVVFLDQITDSETARIFATRMLESLSVPYCLKGYDIQSNASIGIATGIDDYCRAEELIRDADLAMFRAKRTGGARYVEFDRSMRDAATTRLNIESDLRSALLKGNELVVVYQPIVDLASGVVRRFEALLRWHHETRGLIMPGEFIGIAEESNLIVPICNKVIEDVCRQLAEWRQKYPAAQLCSISVNISQRQFNNTNLVGYLTHMLREHAVPAEALKLEITESAIMNNIQDGCQIMKQLVAMGVELHMDDFGTGYSSLNCLHGLPFQCLKIDRSFIVTMTLKRDYAAVIGAIIQLAHNLGMHVIAEGVETSEQVAMLQALECDMAQGFYFSKPLPAAAAAGYFAKAGELPADPQNRGPFARELRLAGTPE
jgi:diguanylate cyclase (GGDEF)-like protein